MPSFDLIVIGGGIVGLSTAMEAVRRYPGIRLLVLEKEPGLAIHQSGRNSGVIHSGVYYKPGSLKARLCVEGARLMVDFCVRHGLPHRTCGKLIVATSERELPALSELHRRALANGVPDVALLGPEQMREVEPHAAGMRALHVPGTGVTDYAAVTARFAGLVQDAGGQVRTSAQVIGISARADETVVLTTAGDFPTRALVNCAGLHSDRIARMAGLRSGVRIVPFRGEYYDLAPAADPLVRALIYPVPDPRFPFLGVHFTRRITGRVDAGPNAVLAFRREGYRKSDASAADLLSTLAFPGFWRMAARYGRMGLGEMYRSLSKRAFTRALQRLVPEVKESDLAPGSAGVRAQALERSGALVDDFRFLHSSRAVHVVNVPSPAATASIPIGRAIIDLAVSAGLFESLAARSAQ